MLSDFLRDLAFVNIRVIMIMLRNVRGYRFCSYKVTGIISVIPRVETFSTGFID